MERKNVFEVGVLKKKKKQFTTHLGNENSWYVIWVKGMWNAIIMKIPHVLSDEARVCVHDMERILYTSNFYILTQVFQCSQNYRN